MMKTDRKLFAYFASNVPNFWYLKDRGWFCRNPELQRKLYEVCQRGDGDKVIVVMGDFEDHLNELLQQY